ncbi:MAG TPA: MBL fold metallo-hydrolase [Bacteroidia bacterium]|nr:MBL fold metallo-hydrolase [Bacteroidia bacterium]
MYIEQIYTHCLSQASYYIESGEFAAIIDPIRDVTEYLQISQKRGTSIKYIFETHFHADFVSGHLDLAKQTGAEIVFGPGANAAYKIHEAVDGEEIKVGNIILKVLHTPGHTLESCCYLLLDENQNPHSVFTGDTLFVGDVGRPDLSANAERTVIQLTGMLYDSIESKLKSLPNYVVLYPGHGAGSACGKSIGAERYSTIGLQKTSNYALKAKSKDDFIKQVTDGLTNPPAYFYVNSLINRNGYLSLEEVLQKNVVPISIHQFKKIFQHKNTLVLDTRHAEIFKEGFIPNSINIGIEGSFETVAGSIIHPDDSIILVCEAGMEREIILRLAQIGLEKITGYLEGGFNGWKKDGGLIQNIESISSEDFESRFRYNSCTLIDVRNQDEWIPGFVAGAKLISISNLENKLSEIDRDKQCFLYCASGYRSMVAASLLKRHGFSKVININGGITTLRNTKIQMRQLTTT